MISAELWYKVIRRCENKINCTLNVSWRLPPVCGYCVQVWLTTAEERGRLDGADLGPPSAAKQPRLRSGEGIQGSQWKERLGMCWATDRRLNMKTTSRSKQREKKKGKSKENKEKKDHWNIACSDSGTQKDVQPRAKAISVQWFLLNCWQRNLNVFSSQLFVALQKESKTERCACTSWTLEGIGEDANSFQVMVVIFQSTNEGNIVE